jgi:hypothetical protein
MSFPRQAPPSSTTILRTCPWRRAPESGSSVFSAISGLREPTDDPVGPVLRDDRDPADAPVRKAAPVGRQRMVAPNEVQDRGFEPCPQRRALGPRFEQGAVVFVAPLFIAVAVLLEGDRQVIGVTGIGTHDLPPLARRPNSAGTANERRARSQEGTSPPGPLATLQIRSPPELYSRSGTRPAQHDNRAAERDTEERHVLQLTQPLAWKSG